MAYSRKCIPFLYAAAADAEEHMEDDPANEETAVSAVTLLFAEAQLRPLLTLLFLLLYLPPTPIPPPAKYPPLPLAEELLVDIKRLLLFVLKFVLVEAEDILDADCPTRRWLKLSERPGVGLLSSPPKSLPTSS